MFRLENRTGYDTDDLRDFFTRGLRATNTHGPGPGFGTRIGRFFGRRDRPQNRELRIIVVSSPIRSRGCAEVKGLRMVIAIASPAKLSLRRLSRLFEHEAAHIRGFEHEDMQRDLLHSSGPVPRWAKGVRLRYHGRAPAQLPFLQLPRRQS